MKNRFVNTQELTIAIEEIVCERVVLKKRSAKLRTLESRYRKLLKEAGLEQYGEPKIL